jgi:AAA+ ATPase superfamily predicted ATPase
MNKDRFIGRKEELQELERLFKKKSASLVVIQGRRRIGKSRLAQEFGKKYKFFHLSGMAPSSITTAQSERNEVMRQLSLITGLPHMKIEDWSQLFILLARETKQGKCVILLDEISWMGSKDPDFLGKLKNAWDLYFKENPELILILCGSVSAWIEKNILSSTGFMGRISLVLALKELSLGECSQFLGQSNSRHNPADHTAHEMFKLLSITGGIPRYLEEIQTDLTSDENIKRLCFSPKGVLFREFNDIFSDLFSQKSEMYKEIVDTLVDANCEYNDICRVLNVPKNGHLSDYLGDLVKSGFVTRDYTWHLKSGEVGRLSHYRLSDNYLRFYLKFIAKNRSKIENGHFEGKSMGSFPGWDSIMGLQFENLVLNNRRPIWKELHLFPEEILADNPFFQRKTTSASGCQIDYLIHTKFNTLYVCEIKFSKNPVGASIIQDVQEKIDRIQLPRGFSCIPILIHVNGVQDAVVDSGFFKIILDFGIFLKS